MKYLITGIAGFVGSTLARAILAKDASASITGIDNFSFGYRERLVDIGTKIRVIEGELAEVGTLLEYERFDAIIHCAAIAPLPECQRDSFRALTENVAICGAIADYALKSGTRDIVFFSSGAIYEGATTFPTPEDTKITTSLVYPTTKYIAELYFESMCRSHSLNVTAIRLFNLYGPHQDYFRKQPPLVGYLLTSLIQDQEAILFSSGEQRRDYIYIDDLVDLVGLSVARMNSSKSGGIFSPVNAGSGVSVSVNEIIAELEAIGGRPMKIRRIPAGQYWDKYGEIFDRPISLQREIIEREVSKFTQASTDKALEDYSWAAKTKLSDGLLRCYEHAKRVISN